MWPFKNSKQKSTQAEIKSNSLPGYRALENFLSIGVNGGSSPGAAFNLFEQSSSVSVPINKIVIPFKCIEPYYWDGEQYTKDNPMIELLQSPSHAFSGSLFMEVLAYNFLITGECYLAMVGNINRSPVELLPISPKNVSVVQGAGGFTNNFIVSGETVSGSYSKVIQRKDTRFLNGSLLELAQLRSYSTRDNSLLRGQSKLVPASKEVMQNISGNEHNLAIIENGGRVSLVFNFEEDLSVEDYKLQCERIRGGFAGPSNAGKTLVTTGGKLSVDELGVNNKDMDFAALQEMSKRAIAMQYNVPLPLVTTDASTFNNYEQAILALYDDAVLPLCKSVYEFLTLSLKRRFGDDNPASKITYKPSDITAIKMRALSEVKLRREMNLETVNELRSEIGRESVDGGDDVYQASTLIPVGTDLITDDNLDKPRL